MNVIDYRPLLVDGRAYTVAVVPDDDASTEDADCHTTGDIDANHRGDWRFVGLVVTRDDGRKASLWAIHYGTSPGWSAPVDLNHLISEDYYVPALIREISEWDK